jgi:hypothetical protein
MGPMEWKPDTTKVRYVWFPTHGRMSRRIRRHGGEDWFFRGQLFSINPFRAGLVYEHLSASRPELQPTQPDQPAFWPPPPGATKALPEESGNIETPTDPAA